METQVGQVRPDFLEKIQKRQKERQASFEALRKSCKLDERANTIVSLSVFDLLKKLQSRDFSASEVLSAYTAKALEATDKVNCVTEFVPQAAQWAAELDEKAKNKEAVLGPLHGLPIAIKDDQDVVGMDTTMGFAHNLYKPAKESAVVVQVLMKQGAIPFCKTNLPQSILSFGSDNPIYGICKNGLRPDLAPGGSSSGAGAIVAAGGAPLATGSDLGGSLRSPSHNHGLCSLRGTTNRLSEKGTVEAIPVITQRGVPGIISPDAKTLAFLWKCLTENNLQNELDPMAVPIPWNETLFSSKDKLRIGYYTSLPFFPAFPDTEKTVIRARDALLAEGHKVVPFEMPDDFKYVKIIFEHLFGNQDKWLKDKFEGEPLAICMKDFIEELRAAPQPGSRKTSSLRESILSGAGGIGDEQTSSENVLTAIYQKRVIALDFFDRMDKTGVDLLLCPVTAHPAVRLEYGHRIMGGVVYTMLYNYIDVPAGVVKFGIQTPSSIDSYDDQGDSFLSGTKDALQNSAGMPIGVQVVGKPYKEELVLRALVEIERLRDSL